jgi:hypothetical protein
VGRALTSLHIVIFHAKINGSDPIWEAASGPDSVDLNLVVVQKARTDPRENGGGREERRVEKEGREEAPGSMGVGRREDRATPRREREDIDGVRAEGHQGSNEATRPRSSFLLG